MMQLVNAFKAADSATTDAEVESLFALSNSWYSVFLVTYAVEFLCMFAAKLMVSTT